jgi:hypothetical protein
MGVHGLNETIFVQSKSTTGLSMKSLVPPLYERVIHWLTARYLPR